MGGGACLPKEISLKKKVVVSFKIISLGMVLRKDHAQQNYKGEWHFSRP